MRRFIYVFYLIASILIFASPCQHAAAPSHIEGYVKDAVSGEPLFGANIVLMGTSIGAATDMNGKYSIRNIPAGAYTLRVTYIGYTSEEVSTRVEEGITLTHNFELSAVGLEGETVVVTAQAVGQNQAINQQLAATQIKNVVSAARIQEIPDANAAESVGRLPGVLVLRSGGEGTKVVVRGLSPKYNQIMINGVQMPATDIGDRSTDLSMISPNMLEGIEVTKAITPDMDADVLGGAVNFKLREGGMGKTGLGLDFLAQGGYNDLRNTYNDYKFVGSFDARFFEQRLGVFVQANAERKNRASNELGATYRLNGDDFQTTKLNLNNIPRDRKRYGGTLVLDYIIPDGKISLLNFGSIGDTKTQNRGDSYEMLQNIRSYTTTDSRSKLSVISNILSFESSFSLVKMDAAISHSYSENDNPDNITFYFTEAAAGLPLTDIHPKDIPNYAVNNLSNTYLQNITDFSNFSSDRELTGSLNFEVDANISKMFTGKFKFGGKYRYKKRAFNYDQGNGRLDLASGADVRQNILNAFPWMRETVPSSSLRLPITLFADPDFDHGTFLEGKYPIGMPVNIPLMWDVLDVAKEHGSLEAYSHNDFMSKTSDYSGNEYRSAGYVMYTINLGTDITFIPGVRYENFQTSYTGNRGVQTASSTYSYNSRDTTMDFTHEYWLPMVHLRYKPFSWFDVRFAYTNTLNFPDNSALNPRIAVGFTSITWNNFRVKPAQSHNFDLYFSFYDNAIGLLTAGGFLKKMDDMIFTANDRVVIDPADYEGIPNSSIGKYISTTINNPFQLELWGIEMDWQTHFWYLPGVLNGLVMNINYTHIFSEGKYPLTRVDIIYIDEPPYTITNVVDTFYTDRFINQPRDLFNLTLGYDYKDFSARISMLYQTDIFSKENFWLDLRSSTDDYIRWDISMKQNLPWYGIQLFFNVNNITSSMDVDLNHKSSFPTSEQHYGMTADVGVRWNL